MNRFSVKHVKRSSSNCQSTADHSVQDAVLLAWLGPPRSRSWCGSISSVSVVGRRGRHRHGSRRLGCRPDGRRRFAFAVVCVLEARLVALWGDALEGRHEGHLDFTAESACERGHCAV